MPLNSTDVKYTPEGHFQIQKMLKNSKHFAASCLQLLDLKVPLKRKERELVYHPHFIYEGLTSLGTSKIQHKENFTKYLLSLILL